MSTLRIVLGDQLSSGISSLRDIEKNDTVLFYEGLDEFTHVKHHKKKIAFLMSARRHFAEELKADGFKVKYIFLEDKSNTQNFATAVKLVTAEMQPAITKIIITQPSEWYLKDKIDTIKKSLNKIELEVREPDHFLCSDKEFFSWASGRKVLTMEYFYRMMRKKYNILLTSDLKPKGGKWNFDHMNRNPLKGDMKIPEVYLFEADTISKKCLEIVAEKFSDHFGDLEPFDFAVTREDALIALKNFIEERLVRFGSYQDAMVESKPFLFHSCLSMYINVSLLSPLECIAAAETAYNSGKAPINSVEGFIRQILGWREYVRGIYEYKMPSYRNENFLEAKKNLPEFFWSGKTEMNCLHQCISETKRNAYAHHIQRLMVLGNFCLIAGIDPKEVNEWYWIVYADAFEWVELPNVSGMILFADGGLLGTKPYAASGTYINKMSNYCANCKYSPTVKLGKKACPFNYLYWDFMIRNKDRLKNNHRMRLTYSTLDKMSKPKVKEIEQNASNFFENMSW